MPTQESHTYTVIDAGLQYRAGEPVLVRIVRRDGRVSVSDDGAALTKAGRAHGWQAVAARLSRDSDVNISRQGVVSLPVVAAGPGLDVIVSRIARASLAFYEDVLDLGA
jgi:hypothetical protein